MYDDASLISIYSYIAIATVIAIIPGWVIHYESIKYKDHVIATITAYDRYISHELRAPLNSADMGIAFCLSKIPAETTDPDLKVIRESLSEIQIACGDGLGILNDLLSSDKIESGLAKLNKEVVNVKSFIVEYLSMFKAQIRAKNISLEMTNGDEQLSNTLLIGDNRDTSSDIKSNLMGNNSSVTNSAIAVVNTCVIAKTEHASITNNNDANNSESVFALFEGNNNGEVIKTTDNKLTDDTINHDDILQKSSSVQDDDVAYIDKSKFGQVLRNVMSNAIKFSPLKGSIKLSMKFVISTKSLFNKESTMKETSNHPYNDSHKHSNLLVVENELPYRKLLNFFYNLWNAPSKNTNTKLSVTTNKPSLQQDMLVIEVKDSGAGIKVEDQSRLFKEIVQFNPEKLQAGGGSGLGMWISKSIVDMHGGQLSVYSEGEGKGSTFRIEIPMTRQVKTPELDILFTTSTTSSNSQSSSEDYGMSTTKKKILIVDDAPINRKFLRKLLEQRGHECDEAEDGLEALNMVQKSLQIDHDFSETDENRSSNYDVILMDFVMPNMNGPDATRAIREFGYTGPIIGVTGNTLNEDKATFINAGASDVIIKPLKMQKLVEIVKL